jgi:hypothetical protein
VTLPQALHLIKKYHLDKVDISKVPKGFMEYFCDPTKVKVAWDTPLPTLLIWARMMLAFYQAFAYPSDDPTTTIGSFKYFKFDLELLRDLPEVRKYHKYGPADKSVLEPIAEEKRNMGVWKDPPPDPKWVSYVHAVMQHGKPRAVVNFQQLNQHTRPIFWPPHRIEDLIRWIFNERFTFINYADLKSAFNQILNDENIFRLLGLGLPHKTMGRSNAIWP